MGSSIVFRAKGFKIPDQLKGLVLNNNPTGFGLALVKDGAIEVSSAMHKLTVEELTNYDTQLKDLDTLWSFWNYPEATEAKELQPFRTLVQANGKLSLVTVVDGEFKGYEAPGTPHVTDFCMHEQAIRPKFERIFRLCGHDIEKFLTELKQQDMREDLMQTHIGRGHITFLTATGECLSFHQGNKFYMEFPWGWTSNNYGYVEGQAPAAAPVEPEKPKGILASIGIPGLTNKPTAAAAPAAPAAKPTASPSGPKVPIAGVEPIKVPQPSLLSSASVHLPKADAKPVPLPATIDRAEVERQLREEVLSCPAGLMGKPRKEWFRNNAGHLPPDYKDNDKVQRSEKMITKMANKIISEALKNKGEVKMPVGSAAVTSTAPKIAIPGITPATPATAEAFKKDVAPHSVPAPTTNIKEVLGKPNNFHLAQPFLSAEEKKALAEYLARPDIQKLIGASPVFWTDKHVDPSKFQAVEKKLPTFWANAGLDGIHNVINWDLPMWLAIIDHNPLAAAIALLDFRDELVKSHIMLENLTDPNKKPETQPAAAPAPKPASMAIGIPGLRKAG